MPALRSSALLLLLLFTAIPVESQDCHDPISGCDPSENEDSEDDETGGGADGCTACSAVSAEYEQALTYYLGSAEAGFGPGTTQGGDSELVSADHYAMEVLTGTDGVLGFLSAAQLLSADSRQTYEQAIALSQAAADTVTGESLTKNSSTAGDPNILAVGALSHAEVDLAFRHGSLVVAAARSYRSDRSQWSSFGTGWSSNFDSRIILGTNPGLASTRAQIASSVERLEELLASCSSEVERVRDTLTSHLQRRVAPHYAAAVEAENRARSAYNHAYASASGPDRPRLVAETQDLLNRAAGTARAYRKMRTALEGDIALVAGMTDTGEALDVLQKTLSATRALEKKAGIELQQSEAHLERNRYVLHSGDPAEFDRCGVNAVTLIDEEGLPHLYRAEPPAHEAAASYDDGTPNFYPAGSLLIPANPRDPPLSLLSDGRWLLTKQNGIRILFDGRGLLTRSIDRNGNSISVERDDRGNLTGVVDDLARRLAITTEGGRVVSVTDPVGRSVRYGYDDSNRLVSVVDPSGVTVRYHYSEGLLSTIEKPDGSRIEYAYRLREGRQVLATTTDEEGKTEHFEYGEGLTVHTTPAGIQTEHHFDRKMRETRVAHGDGTFRSFEYNERGDVVQEVDELGCRTSYERDEAGNPTKTVFPDGSTKTVRYTKWNLPAEVTDPRGGVTRYSYDERGNLLTIVYPDHARVGYSYDARGNPVARRDERGNTWRFDYDRFGYLSGESDPTGSRLQCVHDPVGRLLSVVDQLGSRRSFEYDADGQRTRTLEADGSTIAQRYDIRKDLVLHVDQRGKGTTYGYDRRHLCTRVVDPLGSVREFRYRADRKLIQVSVDGMPLVTYGYDRRGNLATVQEADSERYWSFSYDPVGRLLESTDPNGNTHRLKRDPLGRIISLTDPLGATRRFEYDPNGNVVSVTDELGSVWSYTFDARNRPVEQRNPLGEVRRYAYDECGNLLSLTDEIGETTVYEYDECNRPTGVIDALGGTVRLAYSERGELVRYTNPAGNSWGYTYDRLGRIVSEVGPLGGRRSVAYGPGGRPIEITDARGSTVTCEYDDSGKLIRRLDPYGAASSFSYDKLGNLTSRCGPRGDRWSYMHDSSGRIEWCVDPLGSRHGFGYDACGNLVSSQDATGNVTRFERDAIGRVVARTDPMGNRFTWSYDAAGNLISETDPFGNSYRWKYDALSRPIEEVNRSGATRSYRYDAAGNIVSERDFNGTEIFYRYDALHRLTAILTDGDEAQFIYDRLGNIVGALNSNSDAKYAYDEESRLVAASSRQSGSRIEYSYDPEGNRTSINDELSGHRVEYRYGRNGELTGVVDPTGGVTSFEYDVAGNETEVRRPNGVVENRSYDLAGRPTSILVRSSGVRSASATIWGRVYLYDPAGRRRLSVDSKGAIIGYRYDAAGRLTELQATRDSETDRALDEAARSLRVPSLLPGPSSSDHASAASGSKIIPEYLDLSRAEAEKVRGLLEAYLPLSKAFFSPMQKVRSVRYRYDRAGNRVSQDGDWGSIEYTYGVDHELLTAGNRRFSYDRDGNLIHEALGGEEIEYDYSHNNRLANVQFQTSRPARISEASAAPTTIAYAYDALGRRVTRRTSGPSETLQRYIYADLSLRPAIVVNSEVVRTAGRTNASRGSAGSRYRYLRLTTREDGPESQPAQRLTQIHANGRLLATVSRETTLSYSEDVLGSIIAVTSFRGEVERLAGYGPFGATSITREANWPTLGFAGKRSDPLTGFYDYGMRDYSPTLARWITPDPIKSGNNWYTYADNDPVNLLDPTGLLLMNVSLTYYQDWNPRTQRTEPYADQVLGNLPSDSNLDRRRNPETVGKHGCLLTAATRIANSLNRNEQLTPADANNEAIRDSLYSAAHSGQVDELTSKSTATLISRLTSKPVTQTDYSGSEKELQRTLVDLNADGVEHYAVAHLFVQKPKQSYYHFVNVQAINEDGRVIVADTSGTDRYFVDEKKERLVGITDFRSKSK